MPPFHSSSDRVANRGRTLTTAIISPADRQSIRILVVDDERSLRESCASILRHEGYQVETAGRGREALEILSRRSMDIVLLDLYMGDVPGAELLRASLATHRDTI